MSLSFPRGSQGSARHAQGFLGFRSVRPAGPSVPQGSTWVPKCAQGFAGFAGFPRGAQGSSGMSRLLPGAPRDPRSSQISRRGAAAIHWVSPIVLNSHQGLHGCPGSPGCPMMHLHYDSPGFVCVLLDSRMFPRGVQGSLRTHNVLRVPQDCFRFSRFVVNIPPKFLKVTQGSQGPPKVPQDSQGLLRVLQGSVGGAGIV